MWCGVIVGSWVDGKVKWLQREDETGTRYRCWKGEILLSGPFVSVIQCKRWKMCLYRWKNTLFMTSKLNEYDHRSFVYIPATYPNNYWPNIPFLLDWSPQDAESFIGSTTREGENLIERLLMSKAFYKFNLLNAYWKCVQATVQFIPYVLEPETPELPLPWREYIRHVFPDRAERIFREELPRMYRLAAEEGVIFRESA